MFGRVKKLHFVGIGGIGMSGIAEILHAVGFQVTGSDMRRGENTQRLESRGIPVRYGHSADTIAACDPDVVVISSAVPQDNAEVVAARAKKISVIRRAEMLAELMRMRKGVAIAGTHGKTSTTSMVASVLIEGGLDPTVIVGGRVEEMGGNNAVLGRSELLVAEADEFDHSFLRLHPIISVITNIEADHLDCYEDIDEIKDAFVTFANRVPFFGLVICCIDDQGVQSVLPRLSRNILTYGLSTQADVRAVKIRRDGLAATFELRLRGKALGSITLRVPGEHNVRNALAAVAVALELDVPFEVMARALERFSGVNRRFQIIGEVGGVHVVDDYAHHPTEIEATLEAASEVRGQGRIIAIFQPHLFSRTRDFCADFGRAFYEADLLVVTDVYPAREEPIEGVTGKLVADAAVQSGHRTVCYIERREDVAPFLKGEIRSGDWVITLGAGNVNQTGRELLALLEEGAGSDD